MQPGRCICCTRPAWLVCHACYERLCLSMCQAVELLWLSTGPAWYGSAYAACRQRHSLCMYARVFMLELVCPCVPDTTHVGCNCRQDGASGPDTHSPSVSIDRTGPGCGLHFT